MFEYDLISKESWIHLRGQLGPPFTIPDPAKPQRRRCQPVSPPPNLPLWLSRDPPQLRKGDAEKGKNVPMKSGEEAQAGRRRSAGSGGLRQREAGAERQPCGQRCLPGRHQAALAATGADGYRRVPQRCGGQRSVIPTLRRGGQREKHSRSVRFLPPADVQLSADAQKAANRQAPSGYTLRFPPMPSGPGAHVTAAQASPQRPPRSWKALGRSRPRRDERSALRPRENRALRGAPRATREVLQAPLTDSHPAKAPRQRPPAPRPGVSAAPCPGPAQGQAVKNSSRTL